MPSGNTENPQLDSTERLSPLRMTRRRFGVLLVSGGVLVGLTGCAEGTARNATRGKEEDAKRTSVVDDVQATESARLLGGTPSTTPTPTAEP